MEFVFTIVADDKPGIAKILAQEIENHQGNWLESRMASMSGKFAGIVRVNFASPDATKRVDQLISDLSAKGFIMTSANGTPGQQSLPSKQISVTGNDRTGIVHEVTQALSALNANVIDLKTEVFPAQMSGGVIFKATIDFELGDEQLMDNVIAALEKLSPDLMVDLPD